MRPALAAAVVLLASCGCGTVMNLAARPGPASEPEIVPDTCYPFGGVRRSSLLGVYGVGSGVFSLCTGDIKGAGWVGVGVVSLADTPVSLAGDVVTLPVAFARRYEMTWATWWCREPLTDNSHLATYSDDGRLLGPD